MSVRLKKSKEPTVMLSTGIFHEWFRTLPSIRSLEKTLLEHLSGPDSVNGFELQASFNELDAWCDDLFRGVRRMPGKFATISEKLQDEILSRPSNSLHISPMKDLPAGKEQWLAERLSIIRSELSITEITTHTDEMPVERWTKILDHLPIDISISVENSDIQKKNYKTVSEIGSLLDLYSRLRATFDLAHWMEQMDYRSAPAMQKFLTGYASRISKVHFSVPKSRSLLAGDLKSRHHLYFDSEIALPPRFIESLPKHVTIVIEGSVPKDLFWSVKQEISIVRNLLALRPTSRPALVRVV